MFTPYKRVTVRRQTSRPYVIDELYHGSWMPVTLDVETAIEEGHFGTSTDIPHKGWGPGPNDKKYEYALVELTNPYLSEGYDDD